MSHPRFPTHLGIADWEDPTRVLARSCSQAQGLAINEVRGSCGLILQLIDWALRELHLGDPIATILGPFAGDFNAIDEMRHDWLSLASALDTVADNYLRIARKAAGSWKGVAGEAAYIHFLRLAQAHRRQAEAARLISRQLGNALQLAQDSLHAIAIILAVIEDVLIAFTPAKWAEEVVTGGKALLGLIQEVERAQAIARRFASTIPDVCRAMAVASNHLGDFADKTLLPTSAAASHNAAQQMADTASAGF